MIDLGEEVTWEARHLGVKQRLRVRVIEFDRPAGFADEMVSGAFASMRHWHHFETVDGETEMRDVMIYRAPLWLLGRLVELTFLTRYMRNFLLERHRVLREIAESDRWREILEIP